MGQMLTMVGPLAATALCVASLALSLLTGLPYGIGNAIGLGAGTVATVAMSLCLVLAARPRYLEPIFGGLDRMYHAHKWLGITALGAMVLHDLIEPDFDRWTRETILGELGESLGEPAFYALVALILLSWIKRIPILGWEISYRLWWFTHRSTGAFFALAGLHQLLVDKPFGWPDPLSVLLDVSSGIGVACYVFIEFVAVRWRRRAYRVAAIGGDAGATRISLRPIGRAMRWRPGQFAFLSAPDVGMGESHPFTIVGQPGPDNGLHFIVKPLGDWTRRLPERLQPGTTVAVEGPYGRFDFREGGKRQVWVAGGIGITPFIAWVQSLAKDDGRRIHLLYSVRTRAEAVGLQTLDEAARAFPGFSFDLVATDRDGRLDADRVLAAVSFDPGDADLFFCGPVVLRTAILDGLELRGLKPRRVWFELYEFR